MSDYNLGTAHGKVVIDYHDRGSGKAASSLDDLDRSAKKFESRAKSAASSSSDFDSSLASLGGTAASARSRLAQLAAATLAYRAANMATIPTIRDITAKIAALGKAAKKPASALGGAGFALMGRSLAALGGVVSTTVPSMLGSLLSLRAVMRGVPQEMRSWPKVITQIVALSTVIGGLKKVSDWAPKATQRIGAFSAAINRFRESSGWIPVMTRRLVAMTPVMGRLKKATDWMHKGPGGGIVGNFRALSDNASLAGKAFEGISRRIKRDFPEAHALLAESFRDSSSAIKDLTSSADKSISVIAQSAMGIVFAGRAVKAAAHVYHGLAWGIERFTWAMGAAGLGSLAFLKVMGGTTTLIRGTGDAIKQLSRVVLLLPGAIFTVGASLATAMVGFSGFGEALAAVGEDQKKFDEATKGLSDSAKALAVEIRSVRKEWGEFQDGIQEKTFDGLADRFSSLSEKYLPALTEGMGVAADGLNHMFHRFSDFAEQERTVELINQGFQDTGRTLENAGNALEPFLEGMREIGSVGVKAIADYSAAWEGLGDRFSTWATINAQTGQMREWMDDSIKGFGDLWKITRNLGSTISNTFRPFFKGDVDNALERAANATERWISYMSPQGVGGQAVQGFADHLRRMAAPWEEYLPKIMEKFGSLMESLVPVMEQFSAIAAKEANTILAILVPALKAALSVVEALGPAIGFLVVVLSALRTLNWLRKALMWLFSPLTNGIASLVAFRQALKDIGPAARDMRNGVVGVAPGVKNMAKGMNEMGKASPAVMRAAAALNKVRSAYETAFLRSSYGADAVKRSFNSVANSTKKFGQQTASNLRNAAFGFGAFSRSFTDGVDRTNQGLNNLASSSRKMQSEIQGAARTIVMSKTGIMGVTSSAESLAAANEKVAASSRDAAKSSGVFSRAARGMRSAATGVMDVMGGPWGAAFMAATVVGLDFYQMTQRNAQAVRDMATASAEAASAQRKLNIEAAVSGGERNDATSEAGQAMVSAELEKTAAAATKADGFLNSLSNTIDNLSGVTYEDFARAADKATNSIDRNRYEGRMAQLEQQALNDALKATGMTMDEATAAFANGGPQLERLQAALRSTGGAGDAVVEDMGQVAMAIQSAFDYVAEVGPRAAALAAGMETISSSAADAEEKLNALRTVLQSLGLMEDSNFDAAQATAEAIRELSNAAAGAATGVDEFGESFFTAQNKLNPFNTEAAATQDKLANLRENLLNMDPAEAMGAFEKALPSLEAMRIQLGATEEQWAGVLATMGLTPESIQTQIAIQGMSEAEQQLWSVQKQIELQDGKTANVKVKVTDQEALSTLEKLGWKVDDYNEKTGEATLTASDAEAVASLANAAARIQEFALTKGEAKLDADNTPVLDSVAQATGWIGGVDALLGTGTLDADNDPARGKVQDTGNLIDSVNSMFGMGRVDVDNSSVASKIAWTQSMIDSIRGKTVFIDVVQRMNVGPLPASAGTLGAAARGATGGRFTGNSFNLPGYHVGGRHRGYRLPSRGPGTDIIDGFLALNHLGAPIARLDKDEWVINGKSSRKWNRLLAAINRDDPRLKMLKGFRDGGMTGNIRSQVGNVTSATQVVAAQLNLEVNASQVQHAAAIMGQISAEEFADKFGRGIANGLNLGSRDYFIEQGRQYSDQLGIVFGKSAEDANERLKEEIKHIEDKNLKEQKERLVKSTDELQQIADREMMEWVNNNQFEIMGYTMAQSFAQGVSSGQNLLVAGVDALASAATVALAAAGVPAIVAGLAVTALKGLFDAFADPDLWADGLFAGIYKILDRMLAGLVTMVLDVLRNLFLMIGIDLAKVPIIGALFDIKDAANGTSKAVDSLMSDLEALNRLEYKNLGKTGATNIDDAIAAGLGNRVMDNRVPVGAGAYSGTGPKIGTMNVYAPEDKASDILEAATFEMKRV